MEQFSKEYFKQLANRIMFDLSEEELTSLQDDFSVMIQQIELLDKIDTNEVDEMVFPFDVETSYMREDEVSHVITQAEALENAPEVKENQIVVPKVVG